MGILKKLVNFDPTSGSSAAEVLGAPGYVSALTVKGDGTNLATIKLVNATGSGSTTPVVYTLIAKESASVTFSPPIRLSTGIVVSVSGTGCNFAIAYKAE